MGREKNLRSEAAGEALAPALCSWFGWQRTGRARQAALLPDAAERLPAVISRAVERWD